MGVPILAVACDRVAREWGGVDAHIDYVRAALHSYTPAVQIAACDACCPIRVFLAPRHQLTRSCLVGRLWLCVWRLVSQACYYTEQKDPITGETIWGGVGPDGAPIGGTAFYLARTIGAAVCGVIAIAGGQISAAEVRYALEREPSAVAPVAFIQAEPAQPYAVTAECGADAALAPVGALLAEYEAAGRLPRGAPPAFRFLGSL
jgi:hypothetical protein